MKIVLCIILILVLVFTFAACGNGKGSGGDLGPTITLDAFLKALKARDMDTLALYYEGDISDLSLEDEIDDPLLSALIDKMIDKALDFEYTLDNEQIDGNNATVDVLFKTYDIESILKGMTDDLLSNILDLGILTLDQDDLEEKIRDILDKDFTEAIKNAKKDLTITVPVKLVKKGGKWMVKDINKADDLMYALSGGLSKFSEGASKIFG